MAKNMRECHGCSQPFRLSELHIDPNTSEWYCDPCYQIMMLERVEPREDWLADDDGEDGE